MNATALSANPAFSRATTAFQLTKVDLRIRQTNIASGGDSVQLGLNPPSAGQSSGILLERVYDQLRQVVSDARAALGLAENDPLDTSPEATANRIADFALGFFGNFLENNPERADDAEGRQAFLDLIIPAIDEGIRQAREILGVLQALNPEIESGIDQTREIIQQRIDAFLAGNGPRA